MSADAMAWDQHTLFWMTTTANIVPRAASASRKLARQVCRALPDTARTLDQLWDAISLPPDLKNVVLMVAVAGPKGCHSSVDVTALLLEAAQAWVAEIDANAQVLAGDSSAKWTPQPLLSHLRRSVVFILAASQRANVTAWLVEHVALAQDGGTVGLRTVDQMTLIDTLARSAPGGIGSIAAAAEAAASTLQTANNTHGTLGANAQVQLIAAAAHTLLPNPMQPLPEWQKDVLDSDMLKHHQQRMAMDSVASKLMCTSVP